MPISRASRRRDHSPEKHPPTLPAGLFRGTAEGVRVAVNHGKPEFSFYRDDAADASLNEDELVDAVAVRVSLEKKVILIT